MKTLGSILTYRKGKPPRTSVNGRLPVLSPHYLRTGQVEELAEPTSNDVVLNGGELILLWDGSNAGEFFRARAGVLSSTMVVFDFDQEETNPDYLFYDLKRFEPVLKGRTAGSGIPHVDKDVLLARELCEHLGPKEQKAAANVLLLFDRAIEQTEALLAKQERIKAGLMHDLLTRGLDPQGRLRDPRTHKFKDSLLGQIPESWTVRTLAAVVPPKRPIVYGILMPGDYVEGGVPVIKVKDIQGGVILSEDLLKTDPKIDAAFSRSKLRQGDLLFTIRGSVGRMAVVPAELDGANITQDTARITVTDGNTTFVRHCLEMPQQRAYIELHTIGQAVKGINLGEVRKILVQFPKPDEQNEIARRLNAHDHDTGLLVAHLAKLRRLKAGLMHDLLTGERSVAPLLAAAGAKRH